MRYKIILAAIAATAGLATATPALARDGCGAGWQRGVYGRCYPIKRASIVAAPIRPIIGVYYHRHGYWDGRRYWAKRYKHRGGWRYR